MPSPGSTAVAVTSSAAGAVLRVTFQTLGHLRPAAKPLHPRGTLRYGTLYRTGAKEAWGVPWLDDAGADPVWVRYSRAIGLPAAVPDILGLTLRLELGDGPADVLLATAGHSALGRFALTAHRRPTARYSSLLPYRTPAGPVLLGAEVPEPSTVHLQVARPTGTWTRFGTIELQPGDDSDPLLSFDPMLHPIPDMPFYDWVVRLREGAYVGARSSRGERP